MALVVIGTAAAATTNWLTGRPAPQAVISDFGSYTPQLGFHPIPAQAVLVAEDGDISLYATTNDEGTYCLVVSAPWKRPETLPDGGICVPSAGSAAPLIAGVVGSSNPSSETGRWTYLVAGRTDDPEARTIRFTDPEGQTIARVVGSSGFFVASVRSSEPACANGDWKTTFAVLGANGDDLSQTTLMLAESRPGGVCTFAAPHS